MSLDSLQPQLNPGPPKRGGGVSEPPKGFFCNKFLTSKDTKMKFSLIVNGLTANL